VAPQFVHAFDCEYEYRMEAPPTDRRLTTRQMAEFVANGVIRFDAIVPPDINERAIDEMRRLKP